MSDLLAALRRKARRIASQAGAALGALLPSPAPVPIPVRVQGGGHSAKGRRS